MARLAQVVARSVGEVTLIEVAGELDVANAEEFVEMMFGAAERDRARMVLDLAAAEFIDSTVLNVLFACGRKLRQGGGRLVIVCPSGHPYRVLEAAGIDRSIPIVDAREQAFETLGVDP